MTSLSDDALDRFNAGDFAGCLEVAREGLRAAPDDLDLLVLAGRAGVEIDAEDAVTHLQRATELAPSAAHAWHHLGEALAAEGRTAEADVAFRRTVELDPSDEVALSNLGHTALAAGRQEEGMGYLAQAADISHAASTAAISLVEMYRSFGQYEKALEQAQRLAIAMPDDTLNWLDVAELSLQVGQLDEAAKAFARLRNLDDVPGHEAYPLHGMIQVEIRRLRWEQAIDLAAQAAAIDPQGLSDDLASYLSIRSSGTDDDALAPTDEEIEAALSASLTTYRRMLEDNRRPELGNVDD
jgi:Flp pilus assembly protein TadD